MALFILCVQKYFLASSTKVVTYNIFFTSSQELNYRYLCLTKIPQ